MQGQGKYGPWEPKACMQMKNKLWEECQECNVLVMQGGECKAWLGGEMCLYSATMGCKLHAGRFEFLVNSRCGDGHKNVHGCS